jgi:hypothetical protein
MFNFLLCTYVLHSRSIQGPIRNTENEYFLVQSFRLQCSELEQHRHLYRRQCGNMLAQFIYLKCEFYPQDIIKFNFYIAVHKLNL